jgi:hypothetical protein
MASATPIVTRPVQRASYDVARATVSYVPLRVTQTVDGWKDRLCIEIDRTARSLNAHNIERSFKGHDAVQMRERSITDGEVMAAKEMCALIVENDGLWRGQNYSRHAEQLPTVLLGIACKDRRGHPRMRNIARHSNIKERGLLPLYLKTMATLNTAGVLKAPTSFKTQATLTTPSRRNLISLRRRR